MLDQFLLLYKSYNDKNMTYIPCCSGDRTSTVVTRKWSYGITIRPHGWRPTARRGQLWIVTFLGFFWTTSHQLTRRSSTFVTCAEPVLTTRGHLRAFVSHVVQLYMPYRLVNKSVYIVWFLIPDPNYLNFMTHHWHLLAALKNGIMCNFSSWKFEETPPKEFSRPPSGWVQNYR